MARTAPATARLAAVCAALWLGAASSLQIDLAARSRRCVGEQLLDDTLAKLTVSTVALGKGSLTASESAAPTGVRVSVADPEARELYAEGLSHDVVTFTFTADADGTHDICFKNAAREPRRVRFDLQKDVIATKDYSELVRHEHLKPLELQFRMAEDTLDQVYAEMDYMRKREARLRQTSDSTNTRLRAFSILSVGALVGVALWQVAYLRNFFKVKKLM